MNPAPRSGLFISIDGIDGSGKTTLAKNIASRLYDDIADLIPDLRATGWKIKDKHKIKGYHPLYGTKEGRLILDQMLERSQEVGKEGEFELVTIRDLCTAHEVNVRQNILPCLEEGEIVLADRYIGTIYAYNVRSAEGTVLFDRRTEAMTLMPHLAVITYVEPETAIERLSHRTKSDSLDKKPIDHFKEVSGHYYELSMFGRASGGIEGYRHTLIGYETPYATPNEIYVELLKQVRQYIIKEITKG